MTRLMPPSNRQQTRRIVLMTGASAVAAGATMAWFRRERMVPYPHGEPYRLVLDELEPGTLRTVAWQGLPVWVLRRTEAQLDGLRQPHSDLLDPQSLHSVQPTACRNPLRSLRPDIFVAIGLCTHQGCAPTLRPESGFLCPCHGARYDLAGRVFKNSPAPLNLAILAHHYDADGALVLGQDG